MIIRHKTTIRYRPKAFSTAFQAGFCMMRNPAFSIYSGLTLNQYGVASP
ncbi:hypothetical protein NEISICOT_03099 [Neisseria sicca ATCC 29256]|uniref:Uncharacterized protein n=1 Tax=Neisseria sicca ATCC 29256 TaxID=547045 RepID=C6M974_NEISI|nr:hypothetical protein NEISICOT_03099 [Neisseria sicca ATCC 29256]